MSKLRSHLVCITVCLAVGATTAGWCCIGLAAPREQAEKRENQPRVQSVDERGRQTAARELAAKIARNPKIKPKAKIAVGVISGPTALKGGGGISYQDALAPELRALNFDVTETDYEVELKGSFYQSVVGENPAAGLTGQPAEKLVLNATDAMGEPLGTFETTVFGVETIPANEGLTTEVPRLADENDRARRIIAARKNPAPAPEGSRIKPAPDSQLSMELLIQQANGDFQPIPAALKGQFVFAPVPAGAEYRIRLNNESAEEVAVAVTIDGLSVFRFSTIAEAPEYILLPPRQSTIIEGWFLTKTMAEAFQQVDDFVKTARGGVGLEPSDAVGLIHAAFCPASKNPFKGSRGTARGRPLPIDAEVEPRFIGNPIAHISVRYERK